MYNMHLGTLNEIVQLYRPQGLFSRSTDGSFEMKQWRASIRKTSRQDNLKAGQTLQVSPAPYVRDNYR